MLPGVGEKTAERFALHILHAPDIQAETLAADIIELKTSVKLCRLCFALSDREICKICSDPSRDQSLVCVVESPTDMASIERSNAIKEIILATKTNVEGEATSSYILEKLKTTKIKITRIASGIPMGGDLQYIDQMTMQKAIEKRYGY